MNSPDPTAPTDTRALSASYFAVLDDPTCSEDARQEARDQLVHLHLRLVEHLARRFSGRGEPYDDLVQVGTIGLIKAVDRFETARGLEFSTYATPTIVGEIKRHFRDRAWAIRVPRRLQELRQAISTATADLSQELGQSPTVHQLAERLEITDEEVLEGLESANAYTTLSLDAPEGPGERSLSLAESLGEYDEALATVEDRESIKPLLDQLDERSRTILGLRFFRGMTQSQIAAEIGISQMHVSRLISRALESLRERLEEPS